MDAATANISCPVCTLYLRPGITLKSHLASHPKQKVIEALVRLAAADDGDAPKLEVEGAPSSSCDGQVATNQPWGLPIMPPVPGNHLFIYQQSMASGSSVATAQQNLLSLNPMSQQYVIPTVINPQMMPYIYQQQLIMSSGGLPQMRQLPPPVAINELPPDLANNEKKIQEIVIDDEHSLDSIKDDPVCEEINDKVEDECEKLPPQEDEDPFDVIEEATDKEPIIQEIEDELIDKEEHDKASQTQVTNEPFSPKPTLQEEVLEEIQMAEKTDFYFGQSEVSYPPIDVTAPVYPNAGGQLDFVDMDGMHVVINDMNEFSANQIISQVENFEESAPDRPGILMTIGGMVDHGAKDEFDVVDHQDADNSMSRESSNVNIRADERMPPRGELSGQESIGGTSDITWHRVQYNECSSGMSNSFDLLGRENWGASDSSDIEDVPPLQSRIPIRSDYAETVEDDIDNDTPTIVSVTGPPLNFKCPSCDEAFAGSKERKEHEAKTHPERANKRANQIGGGIGRKNVKKVVLRLKPESENNFDNVFTNRLKFETPAETETATEEQTFLKTEDGGSVEMKSVCPLCECVLMNAKALREHQLNVHNITAQTRHKCATCDKVFPNDYKFSEHLRVHPLECKLCGKLFYRRQNIQLHMRRHMGIKPYKCEVCEKSFLTKQKLDEHRNVHTGEAPIKCNLCDETFRRHSNLVQHRNRHHLKVKKKVKDYICFCKEIFHSKKKLAWHKETHEAKPKSCTQCNEKFIHMSSLTRHMRRAHNDRFLPNGHKNSENVECPICKGIYLKSSLEVHIRNHSGQRPYSCLICNKDFTTKWNLKLHKWTHASRVAKPFKCDQCKGAFIRETDYIAHMNSHKSIRPYTCNYCGAQFIRKYNCQRHVKEHENEKNFMCKVCGKTFHRSYYLVDHMRIHSGLRPFSCHICGKTSTTKSNHNKHVMIHHAREPVSTEN